MSKDNKEKDKLLRITLKGLDDKYEFGLYDWLKKSEPKVYVNITGLENEIDNNFSENGSTEELKALLRSYWIVHIKAIIKFTDKRQ